MTSTVITVKALVEVEICMDNNGKGLLAHLSNPNIHFNFLVIPEIPTQTKPDGSQRIRGLWISDSAIAE